MSSHEVLSAASNDRKARLAQLKSLKRKQAPIDDTESEAPAQNNSLASTSTAVVPTSAAEEGVSKYLSGRNYDVSSRNVKLGFESAPIADPTKTLEYKAEQLALETKTQQAAEEKEDKPLDLFKLQPKKPNWDLKRDLQEKMKTVDVWTENAIARIVRERVESRKKAKAPSKQITDGEQREEVGMEGSELVEAMHSKEREEEEERRKDEAEEDGS